jgi:hypothetical protein
LKESTWFQPLNLICEVLVSNFAFKRVNFYRYVEGMKLARLRGDEAASARLELLDVANTSPNSIEVGGLYKLRIHLTMA